MPALPNLVSAQDMADYGYAPVPDGILARASARVRGAVEQQITPGGTDTLTLPYGGQWLLPCRPVTAVSSVTDAEGNTVKWSLNGPFITVDSCGPVTVEYAFGFDVLPDELIELVCSIAARLAAVPDAAAAGVRTEQAGGEAITWGVEAYEASRGLTRTEKAALRRVFPVYPRSRSLL